MKKSNIIYASIIGAIILAIVLYFSIRHEHTEGDGDVHSDGETHTEESHSDEKEPSAIKEVEFNEAQFKASSVECRFSLKEGFHDGSLFYQLFHRRCDGFCHQTCR